MNPNMAIKRVVSNFTARLAAEIAKLKNPSVADIEKQVRNFYDWKQDKCDICHQPYEKAAYLSNGEDYDSFKGGTICKKCLEKALEVIG